MSIADIVIIVLVVLMALIGLWKGFFKSLVTFCGWFVSILVSMLIARVVAEALLDVPALGNFVAGSEGFSLFGFFKGMLPEELLALESSATEAQIRTALGDGVVAAIVSPFIGVLTNTTISASALSVGEGIALAMAGGLFEVMVGVALFIVIRIIMTLLVLFLKSLINPDKKKGALERLGGFLLGAARGVLFSCVLLLIVGFMTPFNFMGQITADIDQSVLARPIATQVYALSGKITSNENYYNKLLRMTGLREEEPDDPAGEDTSAEDVTNFADNALVDKGGLFGNALFGEDAMFDPWVNGLKNTFETASANIKNGAEIEKQSIESVAALVKGGENAGNLYKALFILTNDLARYHSTDDQEQLLIIENEIYIDFANIKSIMSDPDCVAVFGKVDFGGLEVEPDLDRLDEAYTYAVDDAT